MKEKKSKYFHHMEDLPEIKLTEKSKARMIATENILISIIENPAGSVFPMHNHPAEQIAIILEGEEIHTCGDETRVLKAGDICVHPSNVMHGAEIKKDVKAIDIFFPPREDHLEKLQKALQERGEDR